MPDDQEVGQSRVRKLRSKQAAKPSTADDTAVEAPVPPPADPDPATTQPRSAPHRPWLRTAVILVVALVVGVVAAGLSAYAISRSTATYQSQALLEIDQPQAIASSTDEGVVAKLGRLRFKYVGLVRTQVFAGPVAEQLGLSAGLVGRSLYAIADQQSLLLAVGARAHDAEQARLIAQAASQYLTTYVRDEQDRSSIPAAQQVSFSIATPAGGAVKVAPTHRREALVAVFVFIFATGLVSGLALVGRRDS